MEAKCYRAMRRAQGKMLREYFSCVSVESLSGGMATCIATLDIFSGYTDFFKKFLYLDV